MDVKKVPLHLLERYAAGLLDDEQRRAVEAAVEADPEAAEELRQIQAEREAYLIQNPPEARVAELRPRRAPWLRWAPAFGVLAAAAVAVVLFVKPPPDHTIKGTGEPLVSLTVRSPSGDVRRGGDVEVLVPGTVLELRVNPGARSRVALFTANARGRVEAVLDRPLDAPIDLPPLTLDDDPEAERLLVIFSDAPIETGAVESALQAALSGTSFDALDALPLADAEVRTILIEKNVTPP